MPIHADPTEIRAYATTVKAAAEQANQEFIALKGRLEQLPSAFQGNAATAFQERWTEWTTNAAGLTNALTGLAAYLDQVATAMTETDDGLASAVRGG